jgi:hypothetical protein
MPRKLKRYHGRGDLHFLTFSWYERRALPEESATVSFFDNQNCAAGVAAALVAAVGVARRGVLSVAEGTLDLRCS